MSQHTRFKKKNTSHKIHIDFLKDKLFYKEKTFNKEQRTNFKARKQGLKPNLVPKPDHFLSFRSRHQSLRIFIRPAFKLSQCQNHNSVFIFFLRKTSPAYNPNRYQEIKLYENKKSVLQKPYPSFHQRL